MNNKCKTCDKLSQCNGIGRSIEEGGDTSSPEIILLGDRKTDIHLELEEEVCVAYGLGMWREVRRKIMDYVMTEWYRYATSGKRFMVQWKWSHFHHPSKCRALIRFQLVLFNESD